MFGQAARALNRDHVLPMASCCDPRGCDRFFGRRFARRMAARYRKRGLGTAERSIVEYLEGEGLEGATVLEVGGGVGELHVELLKRGAAHAVNLELSPAYDEEAARLLAETALEGRVERRLHDIAVDPDAVEPVDVVVLHRVVCCYPDYERLLGAAAVHARRALVFSYPRRNAISRAIIAAENAFFRLSGRSSACSRTRRRRCSRVLGEHGLAPRFAHEGFAWQVQGLAR